VRFGLVGCGVIGTLHARLIASLAGSAELAAAADLELPRAKLAAEAHGADAYTSLDELLVRDDIDAVSVCLPSGSHAEAAVRALEAGKHVLIEKPIDITLAAADRIIAAERRSGKTVAVISQRRFQPAPRRVHDAVVAGSLGRVTSGIVESTFWRSQEYYDSGGWRGTWSQDGGGALMNQGIHAVDLLIWMLGNPVEVTAFGDTLAHDRIEVEDTVAATVRFDTGAIGTITATTAAYPGRTVRLLVNGDRGLALIERERLEYLHTMDGEPGGAADTANQVDAAAIEGSTLDVDGAHLAQYRDFVDAVQTGRAPQVTTADGRRALALVLGVYESVRRGGAPVRLQDGS
jgi:UDP-N-acetyl-2-amino-2-deoxyglucuronate dehydrogenase